MGGNSHVVKGTLVLKYLGMILILFYLIIGSKPKQTRTLIIHNKILSVCIWI